MKQVKNSFKKHTNTKNKIVYSLLIPAYKEEPIINKTLTDIAAYLRQHKLLGLTEIIVIAADGGDKTASLAKSHASRFARLTVLEPGPKVGKGRDVRLGMLAARGRYILFTDADLATPTQHILPAFESLVKNDVVIGVRNLTKIHTGYRAALSEVGNILTRVLVLPGIPDTQCGFKAFRRSVAQDIFSTQIIDGWGFDIEVLTIAKKRKYRILQMPIPDWTDPKDGGGLVGESSFRAATSTLRELLKIRLNLYRGTYNKRKR